LRLLRRVRPKGVLLAAGMAGKKKADVCGDGIDTGKFDPA
jgi:hypothetical protein